MRALFVQPTVINPTATLMGRRGAGRSSPSPAARHRHHRERRAGPADRGAAAADRGTGAGAHALRHELHQDRRAGAAHRLSRCARPHVAGRHQPASRHQLDGDADGRRNRDALGDGRNGDGTRAWQRARFDGARRSWPRCSPASATGLIREGLHVWLPLPASRTEEVFVAQARLHGVAIAPGQSFRTTGAPRQPAVRISLGSTSEAELRDGAPHRRQALPAIPSRCCWRFEHDVLRMCSDHEKLS